MAAWHKAARLVHQWNSEKTVSKPHPTVHFVSWYQFSVPGVNVTDDLVGVHVRGVGEVWLEPVVLEDDGLEDILEVLVGVGIAGVDAAVLVVEVDGARDGLQRKGRRRRY